MVLYGMTQELATFLHYRNLRQRLENEPVGDPALSKVLTLIGVDELAHHDFYKQVAKLYLESTATALSRSCARVVQTFAMPAVDMRPTAAADQAIKELKIFDEDVFFTDVVKQILFELNIEWQEFRHASRIAARFPLRRCLEGGSERRMTLPWSVLILDDDPGVRQSMRGSPVKGQRHHLDDSTAARAKARRGDFP